jgi:tetratricopeptide (TPR) repeat protein
MAVAALCTSPRAFAEPVAAPPPAEAAAPVTEAAAPVTAAAAPAAASPSANRGIILPLEKSTDLQTHWNQRRDYLRDRDERRADDEEQHVRQMKDDLSIDNLFSIAAALVRESHEALAAGAPALALKRCRLAVALAPALPEAHSCLARALLADDAGALKPALSEAFAAARASLADPRSSRALFANALGVLFFGLLVAGFAFVLLLLARYAQLYIHDVHHLFPAGARRWQTNMLAAVMVLTPLLLHAGWVPLLFTSLFACALYASTVEVVISCVLLVLLALAPVAAEGLGRVAALGGPAVDVWLIEHGEGSSAELSRLQRADEGTPPLAVPFALARKAKRDGDLPAAEKLYAQALQTSGASSLGLAATHNNLGNVYLLEGDAQKAQAHYQQASELQDSLAAPHFNLSRALGLGGVETLEKVQSEQARALELDREGIEKFTGGQLGANKKSNKFVMDVPLDDVMLDPLVEAEARVAGPVGDEARAQLAGPLPIEAASALPILAGAIVVALHLARGKLKPSGRCERCGREVCKRCDPDARPSESLCAQCVNVFIRRTGVDPAERIRKEFAVQAYHRRRTALVRALGLLSGAGHVLMGYPIRGILFLLATGMLAASLVLWRGLAHDPVAVRASLSLFRVGVTVACFVAVYALCLRDLVNQQRAEGA